MASNTFQTSSEPQSTTKGGAPPAARRDSRLQLKGQSYSAQSASLSPGSQGFQAQQAALRPAIQKNEAPAAAPTTRHTETVTRTTDTGNRYSSTLSTDTAANTVALNLGVAWGKQGTWTNDAAFNAFTARCRGVVDTYLDSKFKIVATKAGSPTLNLPVDFNVSDDSSGYSIACHGGTHGRGAMSTAGGNLYELGQASETVVPDVYIAHEFGHALLGASDEYANPAVPSRTLTNDHSIMANFYAQGTSQAAFKVRHVQHLVQPVAAHYPGYTCSITTV